MAPPAKNLRIRKRGHKHRTTSLAMRLLPCSILALAVACLQAHAIDLSLDLIQYTHTAWTESAGLKGSTRSIVQTTDGYLWLGTEFGLVRFDGVRFVAFTPPLGQHLPSTNILSLLGSRDGTLWVGTLDGLASWSNGKLTQYTEFAGESILALLEDHEGTVWVGSTVKLCSTRGEKFDCSEVGGNPGRGTPYLYGTRGKGVYCFYEDSEQRLWVATETGLWRWRPGPPRLYSSEPSGGQQSVVRGSGAGLLLITQPNNVLLRQFDGAKLSDYPVVDPAALPFKLMRDSKGELWIGSIEQGVFHVQDGKVTHLSQSNGLSGNLVTSLFEDREGNIWVGTTNGLDRFHEPAVSTISTQHGLSTQRAYSVIAGRDGSLWIGTVEAVNRWKDGKMRVYHPPTSSAGTTKAQKINPRAREIIDPELPTGDLAALYEDQNGRIWLAGSGGAAWFENGKFTRVAGVPDVSFNTIIPDRHGGVQLSSPRDGLFHVVDGRVVESTSWPWSNSGHDPRLSAVVPDPVNGGLWLGFLNNGIAYFENGRITKSFNRSDGLGSNQVWGLLVDHTATLWVATEAGLSRLKDGQIATLSTQNGLPCDDVHSIIEDSVSSLWLYTSSGLVRIPRSELDAWEANPKLAVRNAHFDAADGVRIHNLITGYSPVISKSADQKLWFAHLDGVSAIDPIHLRLNELRPPVHIEQITADNRPYDAANGMRLPPRIRNLDLNYTALSLVVPEKVHFRVKLEGQDQDWRELANDRHVHYTNLPPGKYRFRVVASNNSGVWNEDGASLDFVIVPAWYQTNGFRAACVAVLLAFIWLVYRLRIREVEEREKKFREAVESMPALAFIASSENERTFVNKGWVEYTGLTVERASGSGWQAAMHPDDVTRVLDKWRTAVITGEPLDYEVRLRHAVDGEYRWFHTRVVPLQDKHGKIVKWCGVATDIEDRKRAEEALALRSFALDNAHDTVLLIDEQARFLYANEQSCRSLGYIREELLGMGVPDIDPDFPRERWPEHWRTLKAQGSLNFESRYQTKNGRVFPVEINAKYLEYGGRAFNLAVVRDISERKRAEQEREALRADLAHLNRVSMLGELAASIAHEINQPLSGIVSNASACLRFLARDSPDLEEIREATRDIVRDGKRAGEVIARIRTMTKRAAAPREKLDLNEIIREVLGLVGDEARRKSVIVRTQFADDLSTVAGDRVQLQQVVLNLIMNAIEAMSSIGERPRELVITTRNVDTDHVGATVEDSGIGLDPKAIDKIFESFYTTKPGGMGMGLSICRSILQAHGGRLWATAKDGAGTVFHFSVPKHHKEESHAGVAGV